MRNVNTRTDRLSGLCHPASFLFGERKIILTGTMLMVAMVGCDENVQTFTLCWISKRSLPSPIHQPLHISESGRWRSKNEDTKRLILAGVKKEWKRNKD